MMWYFTAACAGLLLMLPFYYLSLDHSRLEQRFGKESGRRIGEILGRISGWGFFLFWFLTWIIPQPGFTIAPANWLAWQVLWAKINILHLLISLPLWIGAFFFGISGVRETGLKTAETHRPETVVTGGVYTCVRHPQYLGGLLAHAACSLLLSSLYAAAAFPAACLLIYLMSRFEELVMVKEFGVVYLEYKKEVPMLVPCPVRCLMRLRGRG